MGNSDGALRSCLVTLGALVLLVGVSTFSFRKMIATYALGLLGIVGLLLPDWEFFDRDFKEWFTPMPLQTAPTNDRVPQIGRIKKRRWWLKRRISFLNSGVFEIVLSSVSLRDGIRFKLYPLRVAMITTIYGFGLYKWWMIMSS